MPGRETPEQTIRRLKLEVLELKQKHVYKSGVLQRHRETMLAWGFGVWQNRYFEVHMGKLLCFKGLQERKLRYELPLIDEDTKQAVGFSLEEGGKELKLVIPNTWNLPDRPGTPSFRVLRLSAESVEEMAAWHDVLQKSIEDALASMNGPPSPKKRRRRGPRDRTTTRPIHTRSKPSLLSSESPTPPNLRGFFNLICVVALATNFRLIVENFLKYGLIFSSVDVGSFLKANDIGCVVCFFQLWGHVLTAWLIERWASSRVILKSVATSLHGMNCCLCIAIPVGITSGTNASPIMSAVVLSMSVVFFMKIISYSHTNNELRAKWEKEGDSSSSDNEKILKKGSMPPNALKAGANELKLVPYPKNVTLKDIFVFMWFPTLVYQTAYPRTSKIRRTWLLKRVLELICVLALMFVVQFQFIAPTLDNARVAIKNGDTMRLLERVLKLAIPSLICWLLMFYALFHLWLNILAECLHFGDRLFYTHWWNATRLDEYWRCWNIPVHNWLLRHLYNPCLNAGLSKGGAGLVVFVVSALLHELIASGAVQAPRIWAFAGMMAQAPAIMITSYLDKHILKGSQLGNVFFWLFFCILGQPMIIMCYYWDLTGGLEA